MRLPFVGILFILLTILEIAGFIIVGRALGVWATLALIGATSLIGIISLRMNGIQLLKRMSTMNQNINETQQAMSGAALRSVGSMLLIIPGFITDIIGLLLLLPLTQTLISKLIKRSIVVKTMHTGFTSNQAQGNPYTDSTIFDLDESDFKQDSSEKSPWSNHDDDQNKLK